MIKTLLDPQSFLAQATDRIGVDGAAGNKAGAISVVSGHCAGKRASSLACLAG